MGDTRDDFTLDTDGRWLLTVEGWAPGREAAVEGALALVNGYLGTRAAVEEGSGASAPATLLNGVFDATPLAAAEAAATGDRPVTIAPTTELVVAPDWSRLRLEVGGAPLTLDTAEVLGHRRTLDLRRGLLVREWRLRAEGRTTRLRTLRFASLDDRPLLGQALELVAEDWSGPVTVEMVVDGDVTNGDGVRHLVGHRTRRVEGGMLLETRTADRGIGVCLAAATTLAAGGPVTAEDEPGERTLVPRFGFEAAPGRAWRLDKLVTVVTGRDHPDPAGRAAERLRRAAAAGLPEALRRSSAAWAGRWATADVEVTGDDDLQRNLRFALYHLIGSANPDDPHAAPGARSLTGEKYRGHVFWDTDTFILPFFVHTHPRTARAMLAYRHHTLPAARAIAAAAGWRGAAYAWESADTGQDVTPAWYITSAGDRRPILTGEQEHHLGADLGFAVWQYWTATGDEAFLLDEGAEMLVELARFWASRAQAGDDGRWHVRRVIGPDEYHEEVDDNAYTNQLAAWLLDRAVELAAWLADRHPDRWRSLRATLDLDEGEPAAWRAVATGLVDGFDPATGLIEQHRGFHRLEEVDLAVLRSPTASGEAALGWERLNRLKVIKQADVVLLLALLGERFPRAVQEANFRYYEPLTVHDSSLSPAVYALVAARLGDLATAERYLRRATRLDLDFDRGVTAAGGVHIAALGGLWQALVLGFGGMTVAGDQPRFDPHVPASWGSLRFRVRWRGALLEITARGTTATVTPVTATAPAGPLP
jgi:trehalose/maltose hydrolase-like predicted phosphorylase